VTSDTLNPPARVALPNLDAYARPDVWRTVFALATSVVPFVALWVLMYAALQVSYLLVLALAIPTAGFLMRSYILFHDCAHGSLLPGRRANEWLGSVIAVMVFTPFARWRHDHRVHHATAGDLDRRGVGDVPTLTVAEYQARSWRARLGYRLFRNPLVMFGVGPIYGMLVMPRWAARSASSRIQRSVWRTNLALVLGVGALCWLVGWREFLLVQSPLVVLAGGTGIWLFYVQHQFEETYWERPQNWTYTDAALRGSSFLRLPRILQFFTGSIGPRLSLLDGIRAVRLKLWDEKAARLVTWAELKRSAKLQPLTS
jgi:omega-6 fatty acid desaturase (delta-12 desaturase)